MGGHAGTMPAAAIRCGPSWTSQSVPTATRRGPNRIRTACRRAAVASGEAPEAGARTPLQVNVKVQCVPGSGDAFAAASVANARESVRERGVARFDVVRAAEDPDAYMLCEVYVDGEAPAEHKATPHYAAWRDAVADMMAVPRTAERWRGVATAGGWAVPEDAADGADASGGVHVVNVHVRVTPGSEEAFKRATIANANASLDEPGVARFDVLQGEEDPTRFLLVEVYRDADGAPKAHKATAHYAAWRDAVAGMMAEPRSATAYRSVFPPTFDGWTSPRASE